MFATIKIEKWSHDQIKNNMNKKIIILLILLGLVFLLAVFIGTSKNKEMVDNVACTMDAKICPDGSYVGRGGPNCEFTVCPSIKESTQAGIGEKILSYGVYITPLEVVSDSRCPIDVQCISAGDLKLKAKVFMNSISQDEKEVIFTLGIPFDIQDATITLIDVYPSTRTNKTISPEEYTFTFQVKKKVVYN